MKKLAFVLVIALLAIGTASAQWGGVPQTVTITGTLQLQNGQFAVTNGNATYYCPMIGQYVGFIDGLKEGGSITIEGYANGNFLLPTKFTVSGKSYDLIANNYGFPGGGYNGGYGYCGGYCYGPMAGGFGGGGCGRGRW